MKRVLIVAGMIVAALVAVILLWRAGTGAAAPVSARAAAPILEPSLFDAARAWTDLTALVAIGPRPSGSSQLANARAYIVRQLAAAGLTAEEQPFTASTPSGPVAMTNLIVQLPGRRSDRILLAGHYDTKRLAGQVLVGANDGGSSAAWLLEMARALKNRPHEYTYEIVWFDGQEPLVNWMGLDHTYGSRYYVQAAKHANTLADTRALILVDMIGASDLHVRRDDASTPWLTDLVWAAAARRHASHVFLDETTQIEDDHQPFLQAGVPSVDVIDMDYPPWHTPQDDLAHVSSGSLQIVGDVVLDALPAIERRLSGETH